ncbi:MAG TPA: RidA family protein [Hyphomicrobiales bacterium]|nr:RidA family protein [Rhodobiaceae bacterium]HXK54239.1 RidA family protein [Hyphomicrobiales bacterium]
MAIEVLPDGWPRPKGYANAILAEGRTLYIAGQIGWDENERLVGEDFLAQAAQALRNIAALLKAAGAAPEHLVRMTWYVTDKGAYIAARKELGQAYRDILGSNFPAMTAVEVKALMARGALVEIECTACIPTG